MTIQELVKKLNYLKIPQTFDWEESLPEEIYTHHFEDQFEVLQDQLDVDKHRWYETSITVINISDVGILGVRSVTDVFSEQMTVGDCYYTLEFFEMEEVRTISYKIK